MTNHEYRQHSGISRSELSTIYDKTPFHFKYEREHPKDDTEALKFGRAVHRAILEPDTFYNEFAVIPKVDRRTAAGKAEYADFIAANEGKEIISEDDFAVVTEMQNAILHNPNAVKFLFGPNAQYEQSYFWTDADTGIECKCRPDVTNIVDGKHYIVDYKTTDSCADGAFERSVRKFGYKFQSGMYREGMFNNTLEDFGFVFVAQEKEAPYAVRVYVCTEEFINEGYAQFREAIGTYKWCLDHDSWFGYEGPDGAVSTLVEEGGD